MHVKVIPTLITQKMVVSLQPENILVNGNICKVIFVINIIFYERRQSTLLFHHTNVTYCSVPYIGCRLWSRSRSIKRWE